MTSPQEHPQSNAGASADLSPDVDLFVSNLAYAVDRGLALVVSPYDLHPLDVHLLMLCRELGECTATQLTGLLPADAARISRLVNTLAEKDLLIRHRQSDDRRVITLRLSAEGEELTAEVSQRIREYYAQLTEGLSEQEMQAFAAAAQRIIGNYERMSGS